MPMILYVHDVVEMRKKHPCGGKEWEIMRVGADFRIRCTTCDRQVWLPRPQLEKAIKKVVASPYGEALKAQASEEESL